MDWTAMRLWKNSRRRRRRVPVGMSMTFRRPSRLSLVVSRPSHAQQLQPPPRFPSHSPTSSARTVLAYERRMTRAKETPPCLFTGVCFFSL
jgi:hypothetical protein